MYRWKFFAEIQTPYVSDPRLLNRVTLATADQWARRFPAENRFVVLEALNGRRFQFEPFGLVLCSFTSVVRLSILSALTDARQLERWIIKQGSGIYSLHVPQPDPLEFLASSLKDL